MAGGRHTWVRWGAAVLLGLAGARAGQALGDARAPEEFGNARLKNPGQRFAVAQAIRGARKRLEGAKCRGLLDEFTDGAGQTLSAVLEARGTDVAEHLDLVFFYDASPQACRETVLAGVSTVGSRVVHVCGQRFVRAWTDNGRHAEAVIIHETLHSLGLGENPPTSQYITSRILSACRD